MHLGEAGSDVLAIGDKAWRGAPCQMLGAPGVEDACREALQAGRTSASLKTTSSRKGLRNEQETPGRVEIGPQAPLNGESLLMVWS